MSRTDEPLWSALKELWQREETPETDASIRCIGERVRRRARAMRWLAAGEIVTGVLFFALAFRLLQTLGGARGWVTFGAIVGFLVVATGFSWWNRRGVWRASAEEPAEYLSLEGRQLDRRLRALRFGFWLLAAEIVFFLVWIPWVRSDALLSGYSFLLVWAGLFALVLHRLHRRTGRQRRAFDRLRSELRGDDSRDG